MSNLPLISFVVLNWNGLENTKICLESLQKVDYPNFEIIVVDNGSVDGSKDYLSKLRNIKYLDLPENLGFTGGHIAGKELAEGKYIAIVNNDLVMDPMWPKECLSTFSRNNDAAVVGGKAYKWDSNNAPYNTENDFYSFQEVDPHTGYTTTLLVGEEECSVDSISGAALLIKAECLSKVGYFDNTFFAYFEETDLIARLIRAGYQAYYNPLAHTWHKIGASTKDNSIFYLYMMHRNRYIFAYKNLDDYFLRDFKKNYNKQFSRAFYRLMVSGDRDLDAKSRVKAYIWVVKNKRLLDQLREETQKLGKSYVDGLRAYSHTDVTVIIPCYNYGRYVTEAIESALSQTLPPKEIIVINDGSTDDSKIKIDKFKKYQNIKIIHKENTGVVDTKNIGITLCKTYWTVFLDADDIIGKTFIRDTIRASKNGKVDIVYTDMRLFGSINDLFRAKPFSIHTLLKSNYINNSALIKTSYLKQNSGYNRAMNHGLEDWELYISLVEKGAKPFYLPIPLVKYRQHDNTLSRNASVIKNEKNLRKQIRDLHRGFYKTNGYYTTVILHGLRLLFYSIKYPRTILVLMRSIPRAMREAVYLSYNAGIKYIDQARGKKHGDRYW
jgi:GT2 family glycosyltransferase